MDRHRRGGPPWGRGAPPWWPEGEPWPPERSPWRAGARGGRRIWRLALVLVPLVLVSIGVGIGTAVAGGGGDRGPWPWAAIWVVVVLGVVFSVVTRRLSRPVRALLRAARQVAAGDYDVRVEPRGVRELREFTATFNDVVAGLAAAQDQRRRFLADVTHELRTPLTVLQTGIEAQLDGVHPRDDAHLSSLLDETRLLGRLVEDLHTLALADAGALALHVEPTDPTAIVEDAVAAHAASAAAQGVDLAIAAGDPGPGGVPAVEVDGDRIRQVLSNLLANAVRHTPAGGHVRVHLDAADGGVRIAVADDGPGIPPDQLARIFDRFTKAADSGGSGLGLSIARDLVAAHGGTLTATSEVGRGTTVVVALPAVP